MSDIQYNRNPFSGSREAVTPAAPAGTTPAPPSLPAYVDYNQAALAATRTSMAQTPGYTDYNDLALELSQGFAAERKANLEAFSYMTPVSDIEYGIIRNRLLSVKDAGGDFQAEAYKLATAVEMSRFFGKSVEDTMDSFEPSYKAWMGRDFQPTKTNFLAITDSFKTGSLNIELGKTARAWMDGGGTDAELEKKLDDLSGQIGKLQDNTPRPWIIKALEAGAESAPFTIRAAAAGLAGSALVGLTGGAAAPAALGILKAGASMLGSFAESADTMRGLEYYDMRKQGIAHETAMPAANLSGVLQGAVESLLGNVPGLGVIGGAGASISAKMATKLAVSGAWGAVARSAMQYGGEMIEEGIEEGVQQIISDIIQNTAKEDYGIEVKDAKGIARDAWESAKGGFMASAVMGLPSSVVGGIKSTKEAKALKEYAATTDRQTFIDNASKWAAVESLGEEQKSKTLSTIWESVQKKAKETRQSEPEAAKPFKRTESGTLYTEETIVSSAEEGKVEAILKVGDSDSKERLGYLKYEVTESEVVIESSRFEPGYKGLREEAIMELAAKYPDHTITVSEGAPESTQAAFKLLSNAGIVGKDKDSRISAEDSAAKNRLRMVIANTTPNMPAIQIDGIVALHQQFAINNDQSFSEYMQTSYSPEIAQFNPGRLKDEYDKATALGQAAPGGTALGATSFDRDGKALVLLSERSTFATWTEEAVHVFRRSLSGNEKIKPLEEHYKVQGGIWSVAQEEEFAADSLQYLAYNTVPNESLRPIFQRIADWIQRIWNVVKKGPVDPRLAKIMDELYGSEASPLSDTITEEVQGGPSTVQAEARDAQDGAGASTAQEPGNADVLYQTKANSTLSTSSSIEKAQASIEKYLYDKPGDIELVPVSEKIWAVKKVKSGKILSGFRVRLDSGRYRFEDGDFGMKLPEADPVKYDGKQATLFQYIGERASLSDTEEQNLSIAKEMSQAGKDNETVRLATGWFKGKYDGKWRMEIAGIKWKKAGLSDGAHTLGEAISAPKLFKRYAELKEVGFTYGQASEGMKKSEGLVGSFTPGGFNNGSIKIDSGIGESEALSILEHEIQHAIQRIEGFARGSTPSSFARTISESQKYREYRDAYVLKVMQESTGDRLEATQLFEKRFKREPELIADSITERMSKEQIAIEKEKYAPVNPHDMYTRTAGEIEARDVASRMGLTPSQREAMAPYSSEDIAAEDAVMLFQTSTDTPEFKKWFGDSKVVDAEGRPLVVYHGSGSADIQAFDMSKYESVQKGDWGKGIYFTPSRSLADGYRITAAKTMDSGAESAFQAVEKKAELYGTSGMMKYISLRNGKITQEQYEELVALDDKWRDELKRIESSDAGKVYPVYLSIKNPLLHSWGGVTDPYLADMAMDGGYDGIFISDDEGKLEEIIAFAPTQIKSINNRGTWDGSDPRILLQTEHEPLSEQALSFYKNTKIVNPDGTPKDLYSGHGNVALYGPKYDPSKGTSGGFYATDSAELASRYAAGKFGNMEYYEGGSEYRVAGKNGQFNKKLWQVEITPEIKAKIDAAVEMRDKYDEPAHPVAEMARYISETKKYDKQVMKWSYRGIYDLQNIFEYYDNNGDTIHQSLDSNATDDEKLGNQSNFEDLLDALGLQWNSYTRKQPGVMKLHMNIVNPLYTSNPFPADLLAALDKVAKAERKMNDEYWTKNLSMKIWVQSIKDDDGNHHWATQIPSKAMPILEQFGYDGIVDTSGKGGGSKEQVVIAFYPEQIKSVFNQAPTEDPRFLFQLDDEVINAEAEKFDSWEAWKADVEGQAFFIDETSKPDDLTGAELDRWYKGRWEWVKNNLREQKATEQVKERKEAKRGDFTAQMEAEGGVETLLKEIWDAELASFDQTQASDEEEAMEQDKAYEWRKEIALRLAAHPLVELTAQSVGKGEKLKPSTRKAILSYVKNNEVEFAALYADLTDDLDLAQYADSSRAKLKSIPNPKLERFADMSIAERTALLNQISDKTVRDKIRSGKFNDPDLSDYVRRLEESKKALTKEASDAAAEIEKLGGKLEAEEEFGMKMYARSKDTKKELESTERELEKVQAMRQRVETARIAYSEALASARDENKLSVKMLKKELLAALGEARKEAAFQSRFVAAEIRATAKLKAQRDANRRAILKKPAKNIIFANRQQIITIQEYLRSKKWEYVEELDDTGKVSRKRAYDTVTDPDGTKHKVPRYTTVQAENLKAALSSMLRESPSLLKILTNETVDRINSKPVSAWTLEELQDLRKIIDRIAKEGREAYELKQMMENREYAAGRYDIENTTRLNKNYKAPAAHGSDEERKQRKLMEPLGTWSLPVSKMREMAPILDGGTDGINTKILVEEEYDARRQKQSNKTRRLGSVYSVIKENKMKPHDRARKITIQGIGPDGTDVTMSAAKLSHVAIMLMNKHTREHYLYGNLSSEAEHKLGKDYVKANGDAKYPKLLRAISDNLTLAEHALIDQVLQVLNNDADYDRTNAAVIDLTNQEMGPKEQNYSPAFVEGAILETQKDSIIEAMKAEHGFTVNPEAGFTIKRIKIAPDHQTPIKVMDILSMVETSVDTQEHLIAYGKYVKKLNAVYKHPQLSRLTREGIIQTFGQDMVKYIDEYIGAVAMGNGLSSTSNGDKALKKLRGYQAVGFLAFRWTSVVKQLISSPLPYMAYAPKETLASAFAALGSGNILKFIESVESKSAMLRSRTIDQIFESIKAMDTEGWEGIVKEIGTTGMKGLEYADRVSVAIGWKGVYDKEISGGASEEDAIKRADDITFQTQPSSNPADLAPIYRDMNEWKKVLLMFTSSLNTVYNNIAHGVPRAIREKEYKEAIGIVTSYAVAGVLLGAFAKSLGKDPPPDEPEEWWKQWVFYSSTQFTDSIPLFGSELTEAVQRMATGKKGSPFGEDTLPTVTAFIKGIDSLSNGDIQKAAASFSESVGLATGFPTLAIKNTIKGIESVIEGTEE